MTDYILSCCSTADLTREHLVSRNIKFIMFHYELNNVIYPDDMGLTMPLKEFYQAMRDGAMTRTSQINVEEFLEYFEPFLKEGKDIVHACLSSGITGVMNSALIAKEMLEEKYPERTIYIIDSYAASSGYGLLIDRMADKRDEGLTAKELYDWTLENRLNVQHWFFTTDLTYLIRGGRVSKTSGFIGNVLNICPLLTVDAEGKLIPKYKIKGKKKVIKETVQRMVELANDGTNYCDKVYISNSDCKEDADALVSLILETFPNLKGKITIFDIGTTIGSHTGPGTVALFFWGKKRD